MFFFFKMKFVVNYTPTYPWQFQGKAEEAKAQGPKSPGGRSTSSSKSVTCTARPKGSNTSSVCERKKPTNDADASSLPKSRAPPPILGFSDKPPANLLATTCKVLSIATRRSKPESVGKLRKQTGREVEENPKAKNDNSGWRTNVGFGFGKFKSTGSNHSNEHKHEV